MSLLVAVVVIGVALLARTARQWGAVALVLLAVLSSFSRYVVTIEHEEARFSIVDMASSGAEVSTVVLALAALFIVSSPRAGGAMQGVWPFVIPLVVYLPLAYWLGWENSSDVRGGILAVAAAPVAWIVGGRIGAESGRSRQSGTIIASGLLGVLSIQLVLASTRQSRGQVHSLDEQTVPFPIQRG